MRDITALPPSEPGMRIGLFGGSFNPPHEGHKLVSEQVLRRLKLDAVWWLVTPGNPLKNHTELASLEERVRTARALTPSPRIHITGFEDKHGFRFTYDTLRYLKSRLPDRKLVWMMGADNLASFHRWEHWREIAGLMPMVVYVRPGSSRRALCSKAALTLSKYRIDEMDAPRLASMRAPAWVYLNGLMSTLSSTELREIRKQKGKSNTTK